MTPDYYLCDVCKRKTSTRLFVVTGRETDAVGSTEETGEVVDLCENHLIKVLHDLCGGLKVVEWVKEMQKR